MAGCRARIADRAERGGRGREKRKRNVESTSRWRRIDIGLFICALGDRGGTGGGWDNLRIHSQYTLNTACQLYTQYKQIPQYSY